MSGRGGIYKGPNGEKLYGDGREVKAEPSPAPPAEREWLVVDSMPEAMKILADKLKQAESALTTMREERDRSDDDATSMGKMLGDARKGLRDMTEERDRALSELLRLKPVSDRHPEGER